MPEVGYLIIKEIDQSLVATETEIFPLGMEPGPHLKDVPIITPREDHLQQDTKIENLFLVNQIRNHLIHPQISNNLRSAVLTHPMSN